jgi:hypothetical protein
MRASSNFLPGEISAIWAGRPFLHSAWGFLQGLQALTGGAGATVKAACSCGRAWLATKTGPPRCDWTALALPSGPDPARCPSSGSAALPLLIETKLAISIRPLPDPARNSRSGGRRASLACPLVPGNPFLAPQRRFGDRRKEARGALIAPSLQGLARRCGS